MEYFASGRGKVVRYFIQTIKVHKMIEARWYPDFHVYMTVRVPPNLDVLILIDHHVRKTIHDILKETVKYVKTSA